MSFAKTLTYVQCLEDMQQQNKPHMLCEFFCGWRSLSPVRCRSAVMEEIQHSEEGPPDPFLLRFWFVCLFLLGDDCCCAVMSNSLRLHGLQPTRLFVHRISQAPGIEPVSLVSPALAGRFLTVVPPGKPMVMIRSNIINKLKGHH